MPAAVLVCANNTTTSSGAKGNRQHLNSYMRQYRAENPQPPADPAKSAEQWVEWSSRNRAKIKAKDVVRRAEKARLCVEVVNPRVVWERDHGECHLCLLPADPMNWHLEHVIPLSQGGPHCYTNTAVAHPSCNLSKHDRACSGNPQRWVEALAAFEQFHGEVFTTGE